MSGDLIDAAVAPSSWNPAIGHIGGPPLISINSRLDGPR